MPVSQEVQVWNVLSLIFYVGGVTFASLSALGVGVDSRYRQLHNGCLNNTATATCTDVATEDDTGVTPAQSIWPRPEFMWVLIVTACLGGAWLAIALSSEKRLHKRLQAAMPYFAFAYLGVAAYTACAFLDGVAGLAADVAGVGAIAVGAIAVYARSAAWRCVPRKEEETQRIVVDVAASASAIVALFALAITAMVLVRNTTSALSYDVLLLLPVITVSMPSAAMALAAHDPVAPAVAVVCCAMTFARVEVVVVACLVNGALVGYSALRRSRVCI